MPQSAEHAPESQRQPVEPGWRFAGPTPALIHSVYGTAKRAERHSIRIEGVGFAALSSRGTAIDLHIAAYNVPFNALNGVLERLIMHKYSIY